jgi:hypothetical protein
MSPNYPSLASSGEGAAIATVINSIWIYALLRHVTVNAAADVRIAKRGMPRVSATNAITLFANNKSRAASVIVIAGN